MLAVLRMLPFSTMSFTDPLSDYAVVTSFMTASFSLCPMVSAHNSILRIGGTSFMTAYLVADLGTMLDTNPSFLCIVGTSFMTASLNFGTVFHTHSSFHSLVGTS